MDVWGVSRPSMGSVGDAYDNAMCESFFATLECELLDRQRFQTQAEARLAVFEYLEGGYNPHRPHSALDYHSPVNYERSQLALQWSRKSFNRPPNRGQSDRRRKRGALGAAIG
jgi:transposase InsO family protein